MGCHWEKSNSNDLHRLVIFHYQFFDRVQTIHQSSVSISCLCVTICIPLFYFLISNYSLTDFRLNRRYKKFLQGVQLTNSSTDEDVLNERTRILRGLANDDILRVENLTKVYHTRKMGKHLAVDKLCFGVPSGECET